MSSIALPLLPVTTAANLSGVVITGTQPVLQVIGSANDSNYASAGAQNASGTFTADFQLGTLPADLGGIESLNVRLRYLVAAGTRVNTWNSLTAQIVSSAGAALSNVVTVASSITTTTATNSNVIAFTGLSTAIDKNLWDGARLRVGWVITRNMGGDSLQRRVTAAELTGVYDGGYQFIAGTLPITCVATPNLFVAESSTMIALAPSTAIATASLSLDPRDIEYIGSSSGVTSAALPAGTQFGDVVIGMVYRDGSATSPVVAAFGWDRVAVGSTTNNSGIMVVSEMEPHSSPLGKWNIVKRSPFNQFETMRCITYGKGIYLAFSVLRTNTNLGTKGISYDGINWQTLSVHGTNSIGFGHYGNGQFIIGGHNGTIYTSPNGTTWTLRTSNYPNANIRAIWYDGRGVWLASGRAVVGSALTVVRSIDNGVTWTSISLAGIVPVSSVIYHIAYGNGTWVAVGSSGSEFGAPLVVYSTDNGITWVSATIPAGYETIYIDALLFTGTKWFIFPFHNAPYFESTDGINWTTKTPTNGRTMTNAAMFKGAVVSCGTQVYANLNYYDSNTLDLGSVSTTAADNTYDALAINYDGGLHVVGNRHGALGYSEPVNKINLAGTWTTVVDNTKAIRRIKYGNGVYVATFFAASYSGKVLRSLNGIDWTEIQLPNTTASYWAIEFANGIFFVAGGQFLYTSSDGLNWTQGNSNVSSSLGGTYVYDLKYVNGALYGMGDQCSLTRSTDNGATWTAAITKGQISSTGNIEGRLDYGAGRMYACCVEALALSIDNGITWTSVTPPWAADQTARAMMFADNVWFMAHSVSSGFHVSYDNGTTWVANAQPLGSSVFSIAYYNGEFILGISFWGRVYRNNTRFTSDSILVRTDDLSTKYCNDIEVTPNGILIPTISGNTGEILYSPAPTPQSLPTAPTFANATSVLLNTYRGVKKGGAYGAASVGTGTGTTVTMPAVYTGPASHGVSFLGHRSTNLVPPETITEEYAYYSDTIRPYWEGFNMPKIPNNGTINAVDPGICYGEGIFIATLCGNNDGLGNTYSTLPNLVYRSTNGLTWVKIPHDFTINFVRACSYNNGVFLVGGTGGRVSRSTNGGVTWTNITISGYNNTIRQLKYVNNTWFALGNLGSLATSTDGSTWTLRTSNATAELNDVGMHNGALYIVGGGSTLIRSVDNGVTWTVVPISLPASPVSWTSASTIYTINSLNGEIILGGVPTRLLYSTDDGVTWAETSWTTNSVYTSLVLPAGVILFGMYLKRIRSIIGSAIPTPPPNIAEPGTNTAELWWDSTLAGDTVYLISRDGTIGTVKLNNTHQLRLRSSVVDAVDTVISYDTGGKVL